MRQYSVYKHTFPNGKVYIGVTRQKPKDRWQNGRGYQGQSIVYNAIQKYGWDNIEHDILFTNLTMKEAEEKEIELIDEYKSNQSEFGYNISSGGNLVPQYKIIIPPGFRYPIYANQKIAYIHKNDNTAVSDWIEASRILTYSTFKLYLYLASKENETYYPLSGREITTIFNMVKDTYRSSVKELISNGYLVHNSDNIYDFYTTTSSTREKCVKNKKGGE